MEAEDTSISDAPEAKLEPVVLPAFAGLFTGIITALILGKYPGIVTWIYSGYMEEVFTLQIILIFTIQSGSSSVDLKSNFILLKLEFSIPNSLNIFL